MTEATVHDEGRLQVALALRRGEAGLVRRVATTCNIADEWQAGSLLDRPCDFNRLVEASQPLPTPMQRHWQQRIDVVGKIGQGQRQQMGEGRCVEQLTPELQCLDRRVDRESVLVGRDNNREWRLVAARLRRTQKIVQASPAQRCLFLPGTAKRTAKRTDCSKDPAL